MGRNVTLFENIEITCPHCGGVAEIEDFNISICVEGHDVSRWNTDGVEVHECDECGEDICVTAHLNIGVEIANHSVNQTGEADSL